MPKLQKIDGYYTLRKVYKLTAIRGDGLGPLRIDAPLLASAIEDRSELLYLTVNHPFSVSSLSASIETLDIGKYTGNDKTTKALVLSGFPELASIHIEHHSFSFVEKVTISDLPKLAAFTLEHDSFIINSPSTSSFSIKHCPLLRVFHVPANCFTWYAGFEIEGRCGKWR